jgi:rhamnogalacturonyl hydrolase YesR
VAKQSSSGDLFFSLIFSEANTGRKLPSLFWARRNGWSLSDLGAAIELLPIVNPAI